MVVGEKGFPIYLTPTPNLLGYIYPLFFHTSKIERVDRATLYLSQWYKMRKQITLFEDQYQFCKELKSKRLLYAFVEYMFEDIEPSDLKGIEFTIFNSLKKRMENFKKIYDGNCK